MTTKPLAAALLKVWQAALQESEMRRRFGAPSLTPDEQAQVVRDSLEALTLLDDDEGADSRMMRLSAETMLAVLPAVEQE